MCYDVYSVHAPILLCFRLLSFTTPTIYVRFSQVLISNKKKRKENHFQQCLIFCESFVRRIVCTSHSSKVPCLQSPIVSMFSSSFNMHIVRGWWLYEFYGVENYNLITAIAEALSVEQFTWMKINWQPRKMCQCGGFDKWKCCKLRKHN